MSRDVYSRNGCLVRKIERGDAREMVVFNEEHPIWRMFEEGRLDNALEVKGAIVKLQPFPGCSESLVENVKRALSEAGAARIKVMPWSKLVNDTPLKNAEFEVRVTPREMAFRLAGEDTVLKELLDGYLTSVGL